DVPVITRREAIKSFGMAGAATLLRIDTDAQGQPLTVDGHPVDVLIAALSRHTVRISNDRGDATSTMLNADRGLSEFAQQRKSWSGPGPHKSGDLLVTLSSDPLGIRVADLTGAVVQDIGVDAKGKVRFVTGAAPLLGFGEGGAQFDRRGGVDAMRNGQGGYQLRTHGGRVPIQWLIGTAGWALFIHHPLGTFDLTGAVGTL